MADIIELRRSCTGRVPAPLTVTLVDWLRQRFTARRRIGSADELPDRLRVDMGLETQAKERDYRDLLSSIGW
jgi:hypothetical protein